MNMLAVNGSPKGSKGNTEVILQAFLKGAREAGAEAETIYLKDKAIQHCIGCFTCWTKTPGVCVHKDDMPEILERMRGAAVMVYAMPLYVYTVPGLFKDFLDRLIPLAQPFIEQRGDHFLHPPRYGQGLRKSVLISNAGFPEGHHFDGLRKTFRLLTSGPDSDLIGEICCAGGPLLRVPELADGVRWYLEAAERAGSQIVSGGRIEDETQELLDRPLSTDPAAYAEMTNAHWESLGIERIDVDEPLPPEGSGPVEEPGAKPLAAPSQMETIRDLIAGMPLAFDAEAAGDLEAVVQFDVQDEQPGDYHVRILGGTCSAFEGIHPHPNMTVHSPAEVWLKIARGEMSGATAFMTGKFKVSGSLDLLMKLSKLFKAPKKS